MMVDVAVFYLSHPNFPGIALLYMAILQLNILKEMLPFDEQYFHFDYAFLFFKRNT